MTSPGVPEPTELVEARPSTVHGIGVFARTSLGRGDLVGVYEGHETDTDGVWVLWVDDTEDGTWRGIEGTGVLRYLNHSRSPNVEFDGPELYAMRDIQAGEELLFDYGEEWAHVP